jgi:hypothetical protein
MKGVDDKFWCKVHHRHLTWHEYKAGACFWCEPDKIPWDDTAERNGKGWEERRKIWRGLRDMPEAERQALIPPPAPGPGVTTPSQAMLARLADNTMADKT